MGCRKRRLFVVQNPEFFLFEQCLYFRPAIEIISKLLVNRLKHPVFGLLITLFIKIAVLLHIFEIARLWSASRLGWALWCR